LGPQNIENPCVSLTLQGWGDSVVSTVVETVGWGEACVSVSGISGGLLLEVKLVVKFFLQ